MGCCFGRSNAVAPLESSFVIKPQHLLVYEERLKGSLEEQQQAAAAAAQAETELHAATMRWRAAEERETEAARLAAQARTELEGAVAQARAAEERAREYEQVGVIQRCDLQAVREFVQLTGGSRVDPSSRASLMTLREAVEANRIYCERKGYHLGGTGHNGNVSQLYRLLVEEVDELLRELLNPTIEKARVRAEADDVLSYALQFVWEFDLDVDALSSDTNVHLSQRFPQLQEHAGQLMEQSSNDGGTTALVDLSQLPSLAIKLADDVRAVNGDFEKRSKMSPAAKRARLTRGISDIIFAVAKLTAAFQLMGGGAAAGTEKRNPVALQLLESVGSDDVYYQGRAGDNYTSARKGRHT
eukprot:jgi/Tetstr1/446303/TSEL_033847.t1